MYVYVHVFFIYLIVYLDLKFLVIKFKLIEIQLFPSANNILQFDISRYQNICMEI